MTSTEVAPHVAHVGEGQGVGDVEAADEEDAVDFVDAVDLFDGEAPALQARLAEAIDVSLADDTLAWVLDADSTWHHRGGSLGSETHRRLQELALERRTGS